MARSHARLSVSVWGDPDYQALTMPAQWLFVHVLAHPRLSLVGTIDLSEKRWARLAQGVDPADIEAALIELEAARMVVIDWDTEEVMVRTFTSHDLSPTRWNKNLSAGFWRAWEGVMSPILRSNVAHEVPAGLWDRLADAAPPAGAESRRSPRLEPEPRLRSEPEPLPRLEPPSPSPSPSPVSQSTSPSSSSSQSEIATPSDRVAKRSAVIDLLTDQALAARRSPAPIDDPDAYRSRVRAGMLTEHGDRAMQLVGSYPEWTIQRIAGELTRPDGDEDTATPKVLYAHADEQRHQRDSEALQAKANSDPTVVAEARRAAREAIHRPPAAEERSDGGETVLSLVDERSAS